jgi:hypothetical protein
LSRSGDDGAEADHLQRVSFISDHSVIQYERDAPQILVLAHVLVGKPDSTLGQVRGHASPGHALIVADGGVCL